MKKKPGKIIGGLVLVGMVIALGSTFVALAGMIAFVAAVAETIVFLIKKDNQKTRKALVAVGAAFLVTAIGLNLTPASNSPETPTAKVEASLPKTDSSANVESATQETVTGSSSTDSSQKREDQHAEAQRKAAKAKKAEEASIVLEQQAAEAKKAEEERQALEQQKAQEAAQKAEEARLAQEAAAQQQALVAQQAQAEAQQAAQAQPMTQIVWIAPQSGTKYHSHSGCRGLNNANSIEEVAIENVGSRTACSICY